MNIIVSQKKLKEALLISEKIISRNLSLPILQNVVLKTENGRLKISSTNLEIGINYRIGAKIEEDGEIAVPARLLVDLVSNIQDEKITLMAKENIMTVNTGSYKTRIIGFLTKDFPIIPIPKSKPFISLSSQKMWQLFSTVAESSSLSETRPELSGILLKFSRHLIESAATDSFRLSEKVIIDKSVEVEKSIIIPRTTVFELVRILAEKEEEIAVVVSENQIFFIGSEFEIISRLIDGHYPDYKKVIPEKCVSRVTVNKDELEKSVRLASIFSSTISDIKFQAQKDGLKISSKSADKGEITSFVKGGVSNGPFELSLNYRYLLDGLKVIYTDRVFLEFAGEGSPLILRPEDKKDTTYLIMPLRS